MLHVCAHAAHLEPWGRRAAYVGCWRPSCRNSAQDVQSPRTLCMGSACGSMACTAPLASARGINCFGIVTGSQHRSSSGSGTCTAQGADGRTAARGTRAPETAPPDRPGKAAPMYTPKRPRKAAPELALDVEVRNAQALAFKTCNHVALGMGYYLIGTVRRMQCTAPSNIIRGDPVLAPIPSENPLQPKSMRCRRRPRKLAPAALSTRRRPTTMASAWSPTATTSRALPPSAGPRRLRPRLASRASRAWPAVRPRAPQSLRVQD